MITAASLLINTVKPISDITAMNIARRHERHPLPEFKHAGRRSSR